jgi:phosphoribosyl-ATP pyrophosphohydrolase
MAVAEEATVATAEVVEAEEVVEVAIAAIATLRTAVLPSKLLSARTLNKEVANMVINVLLLMVSKNLRRLEVVMELKARPLLSFNFSHLPLQVLLASQELLEVVDLLCPQYLKLTFQCTVATCHPTKECLSRCRLKPQWLSNNKPILQLSRYKTPLSDLKFNQLPKCLPMSSHPSEVPTRNEQQGSCLGNTYNQVF